MEPVGLCDEWRRTAEWDWVQVGRYGLQLHAVQSVEFGSDRDWGGPGVTVCGRQGELAIPGLLSRMSEKRCSRCCALTGMPEGHQSPKNIDKCRPVAEARIAALQEAVNA